MKKTLSMFLAVLMAFAAFGAAAESAPDAGATPAASAGHIAGTAPALAAFATALALCIAFHVCMPDDARARMDSPPDSTWRMPDALPSRSASCSRSRSEKSSSAE